MVKRPRLFFTGGFLFTCAVGTLLHFVYEWSGKNPAAGLIAPVNESTWEHLKLLFFPSALWTAVGCALLRRTVSGLFAPCVTGICAGMLFVVTFFYTYTGILGTHWLPLDLLAFYAGVLTVYRVAACRWEASRRKGEMGGSAAAAVLLLALLLCFFIFTFAPPDIGLFRIPL